MDETIEKWLQKLALEPIRRDDNPDAIPFNMATEMMKLGLIEPGTETSKALARMTWRVWNITPAGLNRIFGD